jgi:hypothetical protein
MSLLDLAHHLRPPGRRGRVCLRHEVFASALLLLLLRRGTERIAEAAGEHARGLSATVMLLLPDAIAFGCFIFSRSIVVLIPQRDV